MATPKEVNVTEAILNKGKIGKTFKKEAALITKAFEKMKVDENFEDLENKLNVQG